MFSASNALCYLLFLECKLFFKIGINVVSIRRFCPQIKYSMIDGDAEKETKETVIYIIAISITWFSFRFEHQLKKAKREIVVWT
ncbi:hypothetical protein L1887_41822 [Cichorium endivia]|nr:hypothetical protein L1887_41822 [Cichorium endivia]